MPEKNEHPIFNTECPISKEEEIREMDKCDICGHQATGKLGEDREYDLLYSCDGECKKWLCNKCHAVIIKKNGFCLVLCKDCLFEAARKENWILGF